MRQNQWTPLLWAAYTGQEAVVRILAKAGANVQAPTVVRMNFIVWVRELGREREIQ